MIISARFSSTCNVCRQRIEVGDSVSWSKGVKAVHAACPPAPIAGASDAPASIPDDIELLQAIVNGYAEGNVRAAQATLDTIEARLSDEYEGQRKLTALGAIRKGIYRVSLTGAERRYGVDHVNVNLVPSEKYGSVKVGEWHGEGVGRIDKDGQFRYWPSVEDREAPRVKAVTAALEIILGSADPLQFAKAYAVESSTCWRCGADLVDEQSRARLMGPDCFRQNERGA
jgi:hypothetical protein